MEVHIVFHDDEGWHDDEGGIILGVYDNQTAAAEHLAYLERENWNYLQVLTLQVWSEFKGENL